MLIRTAILKQIQSGDVTQVFRRWRRPTVRSGGTLTTVVGVLAVDAVEEIDVDEITPNDAAQAGYEALDALLDELSSRQGSCYRIKLSYAGADPRIALREQNNVSDDEFAALLQRFNRMDKASAAGPWTRSTLRLIRDCPETRAAELATQLEVEKGWFKPNVRKLKTLGLTISLKIGYRLSPRGIAVLERLEQVKD